MGHSVGQQVIPFNPLYLNCIRISKLLLEQHSIQTTNIAFSYSHGGLQR